MSPSQWSASHELPRHVRGAIVRVRTMERGGANGLGSGAVVHRAPDGSAAVVITAAHVIDQAIGVEVEAGGNRYAAVVLEIDRDADLAAIAIAAEPLLPVLGIAADGDPAECFAGFGPGAFRVTPTRIVSSAWYSKEGGTPVFMLANVARQGDSGGPLLTGSGHICGVVSAAGEGQTVAVQLTCLRSFLSRLFQRRPRLVTPADPPPTPQPPQPQPKDNLGPRLDRLEGRLGELFARVEPGKIETIVKTAVDVAVAAGVPSAISWQAALAGGGPVGIGLTLLSIAIAIRRRRQALAATDSSAPTPTTPKRPPADPAAPGAGGDSAPALPSVEQPAPRIARVLVEQPPPDPPLVVDRVKMQPRYVRIESTDALGEAYKEAINRELEYQGGGRFLAVAERLHDLARRLRDGKQMLQRTASES